MTEPSTTNDATGVSGPSGSTDTSIATGGSGVNGPVNPNRVPASTHADASSPATDEVYQRGLDQLRALNPSAPEHILAPLGDLGTDIIRHAFGEIYSRPGLSLRDRELATVSMLIVLDRPDQLRSHLGMALRAGVTATELKEVVLQSSMYGGYPVAMDAMKILNDVLATFTGQ